MDPVINSLVQSPLVRSMSTVPSKASSFVHGVRDNVPPFSFQKVVVQPWNNPSQTTQEHSHKFRIPQFGTLNRAYLQIKTINQVPTSGSVIIAEGDYDTLHDFTDVSVPPPSNYDVIKNKFRIPWVHKSQAFGGIPATRQYPFGAGGTANVRQTSILDPETAGLPLTAKDASMAFNIDLSDPEALHGKSSNAWNVVNVLDEMRLTTNGKLIETVYGETIPAEVVKMPQQLRDFYLQGMTGWSMGGPQGEVITDKNYENVWDPSQSRRDAYGRFHTLGIHDTANTNQHAHFIVPVTLSSLKSLPKNYQTRFVEDLELEVKMKALGRGFNEFASATDLTSHHEVELVLIYHNWHDNIENTIRNSNYKRGVPASVYSTNWVRAATTSKVVSNSLSLSIPLTSRNLITELVIVARSKATGLTFAGNDRMLSRKSDYTIFYEKGFAYDVELVGSGKSIWSGSSIDLQGADSADYDLVERRMNGGDCGYGGLASADQRIKPQVGGSTIGMVYTAAGAGTVGNGGYTHGGYDYSFGDNMAIMRFGFQTSDEFYTGGIALQTISNPTIIITPPSSMRGNQWTDMGVEFDVYVKHANLIRIDSDTGAVTRTLDV